jgi:hypothetical protein
MNLDPLGMWPNVERSINVPDYIAGEGITYVWDDDAEIAVESEGDGGVLIAANAAGLVTLARHLLALAHEGVPVEHHLHLHDDSGLEAESLPLTILRS